MSRRTLTGNDLLRRFASREVVMAITGHSTPAMHSHYAHVDQCEKADVVGKVIELVTNPRNTTRKREDGVSRPIAQIGSSTRK